MNFDCTIDQGRTGAVLYDETDMMSSLDEVSRSGRRNAVPTGIHIQQSKMFVTFNCVGAPNVAGLQAATFRIFERQIKGTQGHIVVAHVTYGALTDMVYSRWSEPVLDTPGALIPINDIVEFKSVDVTTSVRTDLEVARETQFRLDLLLPNEPGLNQYVVFDGPSDADPPTLQLTFLVP